MGGGPRLQPWKSCWIHTRALRAGRIDWCPFHADKTPLPLAIPSPASFLFFLLFHRACGVGRPSIIKGNFPKRTHAWSRTFRFFLYSPSFSSLLDGVHWRKGGIALQRRLLSLSQPRWPSVFLSMPAKLTTASLAGRSRIFRQVALVRLTWSMLDYTSFRRPLSVGHFVDAR